MLAGYVTCSRTAVFDPGRAGGVAMAVASGMRAAGRSRVCWRRLAAGTSGTAPARAPPGASRPWKRWLARIFRVRGGSCAHGELRHCATSGREGCGAEGERYAPAAFLSRRTVRHRPARSPRRGERPPTQRGGAGPARGPSRRSPAGSAAAKGPSPGRRTRGPKPRGWMGLGHCPRPADPRPLRPFPSATPLHPSLYEKRERSEGRRSVAEGKRRSRRLGAGAGPAGVRLSRR